MVSIHHLPQDIRELYEVYEWRNACAVLCGAYPEEWNDLITVLRGFQLYRSEILKPGGRKSPIANRIDSHFYRLGWVEKSFNTKIMVDNNSHDSPTHSVDCFKNKVALEVEWNNKDPFYDRDLNNFRLLFELRVIDVGVIITRSDELQEIFNVLGKGASYGASTTHMSRLLPRIEGGGGGGCPILVFGIQRTLYVED
ncbi:BglII/BstYI family type II restriction endonuclease [Desulfotruncus alcoholivorax]|uniref:BglII/BstYI family type II restriction endonuclease n=1 Tax=Desulfotruncus alcoholivorax TaxID=265477 RepID=UPI000554F963|nr:BglII/BstYI family type II restriction endonuclease [Desulfotruncus alcoholivorax]